MKPPEFTMKTAVKDRLEPTVAGIVIGEDLNCGDYVSILNQVVELPSFYWSFCETSLPADELVRLKYIPVNSGEPLKVFAICLPFVYVKNRHGTVSTLDTRRMQLVRLNRKCAKKVWVELNSGTTKGPGSL